MDWIVHTSRPYLYLSEETNTKFYLHFHSNYGSTQYVVIILTIILNYSVQHCSMDGSNDGDTLKYGQPFGLRTFVGNVSITWIYENS